MDFDKADVVFKVIEVLDRLGIDYLIGGSFASSFYGIARSTNDADLVAVVKPEQVHTLFEAFELDFYVAEEAIRRAVHTGRHFNVIHSDTSFKVDIFTPKLKGFASQQLERRKMQPFGSGLIREAYFASPEDTVLAKLDWYRKGNEVSERQWLDVLTVIKVQRERLDLEYMRHWAAELRVADLLEEALAEAKHV
jgi:hypothetical protein